MRNEKEIAVHAYKFNGWLYRTWEFPKIIEETDEYICLLSNGSRVITADKKKDNVFHHSKITAPTIWYFFKNEWFNIIVFQKKGRVEFYVNIASPYLIEEDTLKYIDFDLDFKIIGKDLISIKRLDEHEFKENMVKYNYNSKLIEKINTAENKILEMYRNKSLMKLIKANLLHIKE